MLVWINSIIQTLTTTNIVSPTTTTTTTTPSFNKNSIELKISPLCSRCIEKTLGGVWFTHIDDRRIRVIEWVEDYFSELTSQPNQQHQQAKEAEEKEEEEEEDENTNSNSRTCPSGEHVLTRQHILFGEPSPVNHSKYYQLNAFHSLI